MLSVDVQMYNSVRDYVITSERIQSLLKEHNFKTSLGKLESKEEKFLLRIKTKWPKYEICANTTVMQFHEMGITSKANLKPWPQFA